MGKSKPDLSLDLREEGNRVILVNENLSNRLVANYSKFFRTNVKTDILTPEEFTFPLAVRLE